jgi:hypothetical protein
MPDPLSAPLTANRRYPQLVESHSLKDSLPRLIELIRLLDRDMARVWLYPTEFTSLRNLIDVVDEINRNEHDNIRVHIGASLAPMFARIYTLEQSLPTSVAALNQAIVASKPKAIEVAVDFGANGSLACSAEFTFSGAALGDLIIAAASLAMPEGLSADELEMDMVTAAAAVTGPNTVLVKAVSSGAPVSGIRNFNLILIKGAS